MADENSITPADIAEAPVVEAPDTSVAAQGDTPEGKEAPAVDPVKARAEKIAQTVTAKIARRKDKVREGEANLARARAEFDQQQAALQAEARRVEQHRQLVARANDGDPDAMKELGWDYDSYTRKMLQRGTPDEKIGALQKQLEAERKAREERDRREQEAQQRAVVQQAEKAFLSTIQSGDFPESALYAPEELVSTGHIIADQLAKESGRPPSLREVAAEIEWRLAERHAKIRGVAEKSKADAEAAEAAKKGGKKGSTTLDNRDAGERGQAPVRELTEAEKKERFARFTQEHLLGAED